MVGKKVFKFQPLCFSNESYTAKSSHDISWKSAPSRATVKMVEYDLNTSQQPSQFVIHL